MISSSNAAAIDRMFEQAGMPDTTTFSTKSGWCLRHGLETVYTANDGILAPLLEKHGIPAFYLQSSSSSTTTTTTCRHAATQDIKDPSTCFQSLCRIIAGQFVSGSSAQAAWKRLLNVTNQDVTHSRILNLVSQHGIEIGLQKPAGLTRAKAAAIVDLAAHFQDDRLTEKLLETSNEETIRQSLLAVKGIGNWSVDMFLLFYLERPDILPLGDLGVRKGIARHFGLTGSLAQRQLCPIKDAGRVKAHLQPFRPYQSLLTYYMWRAADTPTVVVQRNEEDSQCTSKQNVNVEMSTPSKKRRRLVRKVTP